MARRAELSDVIPVLPARDVSEAVQFYVERLGFELLFQDPGDRPQYAGIRRGPVELPFQFQFEKDFEGERRVRRCYGWWWMILTCSSRSMRTRTSFTRERSCAIPRG